ncbi:Protein of unknown function [Bacillus mycoides]|nr:Protein of unknown function [Bacillus mycoides]
MIICHNEESFDTFV